ncbi:MAG: tetratricopeptide repeat protein [Rhodobacteraceae bacterium]|nr:tetratricopeptide repeat protein [Paracoccaceae bacterium]
MAILGRILNPAVTAFLFALTLSGPARADDLRARELLDELQRPSLPNWKQVEEALWAEWSKSGSPAMDLLLQRGRDATEAGDFETAIAHLTALTDHAPGFAEAFNARALAYYRAGLYGPALDDLGRALTLNPSHFGAMTGLGTLLEETGQRDAALAAYRAAYAIQPHDPDLEEAVARLEQMTSGQTL